MNNKFDNILDELKSAASSSSLDKEWLITATSSSMGSAGGSALTSGTYSKYEDYTGLKDYFEEIDLVSGQDSGIKGICMSNVKIVLHRNQSGVKMLKAFRSNCIFDVIELLQIMKSGSTHVKVATITFKQCKITNAKIYLDYIEFLFKYGERNESYALIDHNGASQGVV